MVDWKLACGYTEWNPGKYTDSKETEIWEDECNIEWNQTDLIFQDTFCIKRDSVNDV
jgi:hypothetical protein